MWAKSEVMTMGCQLQKAEKGEREKEREKCILCVAHLAGLQPEGCKHCLPEQPKQAPSRKPKTYIFILIFRRKKKKPRNVVVTKEAVRGRAQE